MNYESKMTTVLPSSSKPIPALLKAKEYTINNITLKKNTLNYSKELFSNSSKKSSSMVPAYR